MSDEEAETAKSALDAAIRDYHRTIDPDAYVDGWSLVTHKRTTALEAEGASAVGHLEPTGQAWPLTVGILRIAANDAETPGRVEDDDED